MTSSNPKKPPLKVSQMVLLAIAILNDRNGSSAQAIRKYITSSFNVQPKKVAPKISKYLIIAVESGNLIRTKGRGAAGSFRLSGTMKLEMGQIFAKVPKENQSGSSNNKRKSTSIKSNKKTKSSAISKSKTE